MIVTGVEDVIQNINKALENSGKAGQKALTDVMFDAAGKMIDRTPLDMGDLRKSCKVTLNNHDIGQGTVSGIVKTGEAGYSALSNNIEGEISFNTPYAVKMHEDLSYNPQTPGTGPKYAESVINENGSKYIEYINKKVGDTL